MKTPIILCALLYLSGAAVAGIVINEIHYAPALDNEAVEFIELYNDGTETVDLTGWHFSDGLTYTFPEGSALEAGAYFVLAQNETQYNKKFGSVFAGGNKANDAFASGRLADGGEEITLRDTGGEVVDRVSYNDRFPWPVAAGGDGPSMELIHPALDNDLGSSWRSSSAPTPGERNSVYAESAPPNIRQVKHTPKAPFPGEAVVITAKVTDPQTVKAVTLRYQLVEPGNYIQIDDDAFASEWTELSMADDGQAPDTEAGDDIFAMTVPGDLQRHRHLMRYQITVEDAEGSAITVPFADDAQPNFAYYCYGEMPVWTGAVEPGETEEVTFGPELLQKVPVYHLITSNDNHVESQHIPGTTGGSGYTGSDYLWKGTLVYDGDVYDHVSFRARGGVWRYAMGKNMWKFRFNRGHEFQARDAIGKEYPTRWKRLNFSAIIQQGNFGHRGEQGLFESVGFDLFAKAGVPSPQTHYVHFRIVENSSESNIFGSQYATDFQGLYLAIEQIDGRFLRGRDMQDGNIYKMENGTGERNLGGELKNEGSYPAVTDYSDLETFKQDGYEQRSNSADPDWWRANFHLERYYSYRSILEYIHHYDTGAGKNYYYYHDHVAGRWEILPWDLDLTWDDGMYSTPSPHIFSTTALAIDPLEREYQNRLVELRDLLFNEEQTGLLIDERASAVYTPGEASLVDADRMMWDYNPIMTSRYVNPSKSGQGRYYGAAATKDFAGMIEKMKAYIPHRIDFARNRLIDEGSMPSAPTITFAGADGYPTDDLRFESSSFKGGSIFSPQDFAGMKWRLAEITDPTAEGFTPEPPNAYEIDAVWESDVITEFTPEITIPPVVVRPGRVYRARARMQNTAGYWSHWSEPVQFIAGQPDIQSLLDGLVISEILYAPAKATEEERASGFITEDFEFLELLNLGETALDLSEVRFTKGIDYDFSEATIQSIEPGQRLLLVSDIAAFESRYGENAAVIGEYGGEDGSKLDNQGERLKLSFGAGVPIRDLRYDNEDGWPEVEKGTSLVLLNTTALSDHALPESWGISSAPGGTPGEADDGIVVDPPSGGGYEAWQNAQFTAAQLADPMLSGPLADPDGDRWTNLQEYAFFGHPLAQESHGPEIIYLDGRAHLRIKRPASIADIDYVLELSDNLQEWELFTPEQVITTTGNQGEEIVSFQLDNNFSKYWRIRTTLK